MALRDEIIKILFPYLTSLVKIIFIIILAKIFLYFANLFVEKGYNSTRMPRRAKLSDKRAKTLTSLSKSIIKYVVYFIALIMVLKEAGFNPMPILAGAGVIGLAVGFGAQTLIRDIISGFFILIEDQFSVDDKITVGNVTGVVEEMTLRCTKVREVSGGLLIIPNGSITQLINHSRKETETKSSL